MSGRATLAALLLVIVLVAAGSALWIAGILRPAPRVATGAILAAPRRGNTLDLIVAVPSATPIDAAGETVRQAARAIADGTFAAPPVVAFDIRADGASLMRLVYDRGVLAAGAVAGGDGDHLLGLAGTGTIWPRREDPRLTAYCGRMETMSKPFCARAAGD